LRFSAFGLRCSRTLRVDPRRPDHFLPGRKTGLKIPAPESGKCRLQMDLHDLFRLSAFSARTGGGDFFVGCLALLGLRPPMLTHASRRSSPPRPFFACKKWSMKPEKASPHGTQCRFMRRQPRFIRRRRASFRLFRLGPSQPWRRRLKHCSALAPQYEAASLRFDPRRNGLSGFLPAPAEIVWVHRIRIAP